MRLNSLLVTLLIGLGLVSLASCTPASVSATATPTSPAGGRTFTGAGRPTATETATPVPSDTPQPTLTSTSTPTIVPSVTATARPCDQAAFAGNVTFPDGSRISAGKDFIKTWRVKNTGLCTWNTHYSLVFVNGIQMGAVTSVNLPSVVQPGSMVEISVPMVAPAAVGTFTGYWMLRNDSNEFFGVGPVRKDPLLVSIVTLIYGQGPTRAPFPTRPPRP